MFTSKWSFPGLGNNDMMAVHIVGGIVCFCVTSLYKTKTKSKHYSHSTAVFSEFYVKTVLH